jgi:Zn-finger nucleic acid-binding protein
MLFERWSFGEAVERERAWTDRPADTPQPLNQAELQRQILCPLCSCAMATHAYLGPGNIVVDTCDRCNVIWLDYGELQRTVNAPGRDRGAALLKREQERLRDLSDARNDDHDDDWWGMRRGRIDLPGLLASLFD